MKVFEFEDITPLNELVERINFYGLDWWVDYCNIDPHQHLNFAIKSQYINLFNNSVCGKTMITSENQKYVLEKYTYVACLLRRHHKGSCLCWHPKFGIISTELREKRQVASLAKDLY